MAQPTPYTRQYSFSDYQTSNPADPLPGGEIDGELNAVKQTLDQTLANIALIQRDDGAIANESVGIDQLKPEISIGINSVTDWAVGIPYVVNDAVWFGGRLYRCKISHTSTVFATDLAASRWVLTVNAQDQVEDIADAYIPTVLPGLVSTAVATAIGDKLVSTSTTSATIGTGSKSLTVQTNEGWVAGLSIKAFQTSAPTNYMVGRVTSYTPASGALVFTVANGFTNGSGTISDWTVVLAAEAAGVAAEVLSNLPTVATTSPGAAYAMDLAVANYFDITLNAASCALTFTNIPVTTKLTTVMIILRQDNTGSRLATFPGTTFWNGGAPPTLTTTRNQADIFVFTTRDAGATWFATRINSAAAQYLLANTSSADFNGSSQWLSISDANFGAYTYAKFAVALRIRADTLGTTTRGLLNHMGTGSNGWNLSINSASRLRFRTQGGDGERVVNATLSTATWYNILIHFDSANATAGLRARVFVNSSTEAAYVSTTDPTVAVTDPTGDITLGSCQYAGDIGVSYFDGLIDEFAFFDNVLPTYDQVFPAQSTGGLTRNLRAISGLKSWLRLGDNGLLVDEMLATAWTNNASVVTSATVP